MLAVHIIQQPLPILRPSKNRTHDWSDNGVCECVRPNNATVQWGGWVGRGWGAQWERGRRGGPDPASVEVLPDKANIFPQTTLKYQVSTKKVNKFSETLHRTSGKVIESAMIPALEDLTRVEEVVRVPGLGFLDKTAAEKLSEIFQVLILIRCWCMYVLSKGTLKYKLYCIVYIML